MLHCSLCFCVAMAFIIEHIKNRFFQDEEAVLFSYKNPGSLGASGAMGFSCRSYAYACSES